VVGEEEVKENTVNVRIQNAVLGKKTIEELIADFEKLTKEYK